MCGVVMYFQISAWNDFLQRSSSRPSGRQTDITLSHVARKVTLSRVGKAPGPPLRRFRQKALLPKMTQTGPHHGFPATRTIG